MDVTVMIVDDDEDIRNMIGIYLQNEGFHFIKCCDGLQAIEMLDEHNVDVILLDIRMPKLDGMQTCIQIRERSRAPIIFMSAKSDDMDKIQGLTIGADDYAIYIITNLFFLLLLAVFILTFAFIIKAKVEYIQYISNSVKKIENNGYGTIVEIKNDDELAELSNSINNMSLALHEKQELEKREGESKNKIIADISHDIRTPLTSIVGYLNLLKEDGFEHKEMCIQYVTVIDRRVEHMTGMINQLFEYTKLIQTDVPLQMKKKDLTAIISYIDYEYQYLLKNSSKKWIVHYPDYPVYVNLDEEKIIRALGNLLDNAKKYSMCNSAICMNVISKSDTIVIEISNETELIEKENLKDIFERFYRSDWSRTDNEKNGTGLGLPIVKRIVELHNGAINVQLVDKTISFFIELPIA